MHHELKIFTEYFKDVESGIKTFEVRKNDRNYQVGDTLILNELFFYLNKYSGKKLNARITYVLKDFCGLKDDYVVLGIKLENNTAISDKALGKIRGDLCHLNKAWCFFLKVNVKLADTTISSQ